MTLMPVSASAILFDYYAAEEEESDLGGTLDGPCAWASVGRVGSTCTGTLIGPRTVLTAGHCDSVGYFYWGDTPGSPPGYSAEGSVELDECFVRTDFTNATPPNFPQGPDIKVCKIALMEDPLSIPTIPIMIPTGPQRDWLYHEVLVELSEGT